MLFKKILLLVLVYLMFYKPELFFVPHSINLSFGLIGLVYFFFRGEKYYIISQRTKCFVKWMARAVTPIVVVAMITCVVNSSSDFEFITYPIGLICSLFFAYLIASLFHNIYKVMETRTLIGYILSCQMLYMILSVLMFVNPSISSMLVPLLKLGSGGESAYSLTEGIRLLGFGSSFFTAGIVNGFVLILLSFYISIFKHSQKSTIFLYIYYFIIIVVGMMMARTTIIGASISFFILIYYWLKSGLKIIKTGLYVTASVFLIVFLAGHMSDTMMEYIEQLSNFAFDFFYNYKETGEATSSSIDEMIDMYNTVPDNLKTWLIGDARWNNENGSYYMSVDIGYLRDIFYFGLVGLLVLISFYNLSLKRIILTYKVLPVDNTLLYHSLFSYVIILNFKGPADIFYYIIPFLFCARHEYVR